MSSERHHVQVQQVMTQDFALINGLAVVREALEMYREQGVKMLIVDKRNDQDEYGLLLISDIAKQVLAKDRSPDRVNVYEVMAKPIISVRPEMDVRYCARLFETFGLSMAPVINDQGIQGVVGYEDIVLRGLI